MPTCTETMANDNRIQLYVSDEVKKTLEAYAKYHDVSVASLLI